MYMVTPHYLYQSVAFINAVAETFYLFQEDNSALLLESGDNLLLESAP